MIGGVSPVLAVFGLVLAIAAVVVAYSFAAIYVKSLISKHRLEFYRRQGGIVEFHSKLGNYGFESKEYSENQKGTNENRIRRLAREHQGPKFMASNQAGSSACVVQIYDPKFVAGMLALERDGHLVKEPFYPEMVNKFGIIFQKGEKFQTETQILRAVFGDVGFRKLTPKICKIIQEGFSRINKQKNIYNQSFTTVDLREFFNDIKNVVSNLLVFGNESFEIRQEVKNLIELTKDQMRCSFEILTHPLFNLMPTIARKLGLIPALKRSEENLRKQIAIVKELAAEKEGKELGDCVFDLLLKHNRKMEKEQKFDKIIDWEGIAGNVHAFLFTGSDASNTAAQIALCLMANDEEAKARWEPILKELYPNQNRILDQDTLDSNQNLKYCIAEVLRLHSASNRFALRKAMKDVDLGGLEVKKDDLVIVQIGVLSFSDDSFEHPEKFNPDRFNPAKQSEVDKKRHKYQYIPFGEGQRGCLGRYLANTLLQTFLTQFMVTYDFKKPADVDYYIETENMRILTNPFLEIKRKI